VTEDLYTPQFWVATAIGLFCVAVLALWLRTGGRRPR
jgi:hypothetical protein